MAAVILKKVRRVHLIDGTLPSDLEIPEGAALFVFDEELAGFVYDAVERDERMTLLTLEAIANPTIAGVTLSFDELCGEGYVYRSYTANYLSGGDDEDGDTDTEEGEDDAEPEREGQ